MKEKNILPVVWIIAMPLIGVIILITKGIATAFYIALAIVLQCTYVHMTGRREGVKCAACTLIACLSWIAILLVMAYIYGQQNPSTLGVMAYDQTIWWLVLTALSLGAMAVIHFLLLIGFAVYHAIRSRRT